MKKRTKAEKQRLEKQGELLEKRLEKDGFSPVYIGVSIKEVKHFLPDGVKPDEVTPEMYAKAIITAKEKGKGATKDIIFVNHEWARELLNHLYPLSTETFALPSHPLMFTLLAMFAGKPERIPKKLLLKPYGERTPEEQKEAEAYLSSILETETSYSYSDTGEGIPETKQIALVSDSPVVEAKAEIARDIWGKVPFLREGRLAISIKKTFGAEGLRHLYGFLIGLEENGRRGYYDFNVNEHLERLGYKKKKAGVFDQEPRKTATNIVEILSSFILTLHAKKGRREIYNFEKLFAVDGYQIEGENEEIIDGTVKLRATDYWYKHAFEPQDGRSPQYTKLLRKIARENHRNHPITIYLAGLLAVFWRIKPEGKKLTVKSLLEWCNLKTGKAYGRRDIKNLEAELNYMKKHGYLGNWKHSGGEALPSECKKPLDVVLTLYPPAWLEEEVERIRDKRDTLLIAEKAKKTPPLSKEELVKIVNNSGLSQGQFANHIGISRQHLNYLINDRRKITPSISAEIREVLGHL